MLKEISQNKPPWEGAYRWIKVLMHLNLTGACLFLLFILTMLGTVYQAGAGLYAAQQKYFYSWFFLLGGFFPFPGAQLVMWVLGLNLLGNAIFRFNTGKLGIFVMHWGIMILLVGSFVTHYYAAESYLSLYEGEGANITTDYKEWELAVWEKGGLDSKRVSTLSTERIKAGRAIDLPAYGLTFLPEYFYQNSKAFITGAANRVMNASGYDTIKKEKKEGDPSNNRPGGIFNISHSQGKVEKILLWAGERRPSYVAAGRGKRVFLQVRRKRHPMPFSLKLIKFNKEEHAGTGIASKYESLVEINQDGMKRKVKIFMNNPLRLEGLTFFPVLL